MPPISGPGPPDAKNSEESIPWDRVRILADDRWPILGFFRFPTRMSAPLSSVDFWLLAVSPGHARMNARQGGSDGSTGSKDGNACGARYTVAPGNVKILFVLLPFCRSHRRRKINGSFLRVNG